VNKAELVSALSGATDMSRAEATRAIDALFGVENGIIATALRSGDKVQITGFGSFETKKREARKGRNPRTGKEINIAASTSAAFRIGKRLKDALGGS
jgi:DNA-binding protein HU-beta